jgi:hypothetical protein
MAQKIAFNAALIWMGFNVITTDAMIDEGFEMLEILAKVEKSGINDMIKNVHETRWVLGAQAQENVTFTFIAIKCLKAIMYWVAKLRRTGIPSNIGLFSGAMIMVTVTWFLWIFSGQRHLKTRSQINARN